LPWQLDSILAESVRQGADPEAIKAVQQVLLSTIPDCVINFEELELEQLVGKGGRCGGSPFSSPCPTSYGADCWSCGSGSVFKGKFGGTTIAAKVVFSQVMYGDFDEVQREMAMLYKLKHPGVTAFYGVCFHEGTLMLVQASEGPAGLRGPERHPD
jgi:hypothetical protein